MDNRYTHLKNKIELDLTQITLEGAFYQSKWGVKINSSGVILYFSLYVCFC